MRELLRMIKCGTGFHQWLYKRQRTHSVTVLQCIYCPAEKYEVSF